MKNKFIEEMIKHLEGAHYKKSKQLLTSVPLEVEEDQKEGHDPKDTNPSEHFGEEIDANPPCCVWRLRAIPRPPDPDPDKNETYSRDGKTYMNAFYRDMHFQIDMRNAADAQKVRVIQYWKNEQYLIHFDRPNQQPINISFKQQPNPNPGWRWTSGGDGWTVDSEDNNRCFDVTVTGRSVHWGDRVSIGRAELQAILDQVGGEGRSFPHQFTTLYKTDIFCSERNICNERVAQNQELPIASVTWRQIFKIEANIVDGRLTIEGKRDDILIDSITPIVNHWCPNSPHRTGTSGN